MADYDALTGKGGGAYEYDVSEKRKKSLVVRSRTREESCCGKKCFIVAVVSLFLFVIFVSLPAGAFLIIHGNRKNLLAFQLGGAMVVSIPIAIAVIFCVIVCFRRSSSSRKLNFNSSAHI